MLHSEVRQSKEREKGNPKAGTLPDQKLRSHEFEEGKKLVAFQNPEGLYTTFQRWHLRYRARSHCIYEIT